MFRRITAFAGGRYIGIDLREDYSLDAERTLAAIEQNAMRFLDKAVPDSDARAEIAD